MNCIKCGAELPENSIFCNLCGKKQTSEKRKRVKSRGNGQGSAYQLQNGKWVAEKVLRYEVGEDGKRHRFVAKKSGFPTKREALEFIPRLETDRSEREKAVTFKALYDKFLPTHTAGKDTLNCYKAAIKYFSPVWHMQVCAIEIDDLQDCIDDCPKGKRTKQNMKTICGLVYKFGIPRGYVPEKLNFSEYLIIRDSDGAAKEALPDSAVEKIKNSVGKIAGADYIYAQIFLGFRPSELLALDVDRYDKEQKAFVGGAKTEAGINRVVTVSPKIQKIIDALVDGKKEGPVFCKAGGGRMDIKEYRTMFYAVLDALWIDNPIEKTDGVSRHKYTPHSCRHNFATMMKRIDAPSKDKLALIGHTSDEMLRYYQGVSIPDLRKITDML